MAARGGAVMSRTSREVGIVCRRWTPEVPWAQEKIAPTQVLSEAPDLAPGASLGRDGVGELIYFGPAELVFWTGETGHYRDNLATGAPRLWVSLAPQGEFGELAIGLVTANPYEGESLADGSGLVLEAVDMPPDIAAELAAFVAEHHVEQVFVKRKRDGQKGRREGRDGPG